MLHDGADEREMVAELCDEDDPVLSTGIAEIRATANVSFISGITSFTM